MRYLVALLFCICFWFGMTTVLTFLANDEAIAEQGYSGNPDFTYQSADNPFNSSSTDVNPNSFANTSFFEMMLLLLTFRLNAVFNMPLLGSMIISFVNYLFLIIGGICIYKLASPFSG